MEITKEKVLLFDMDGTLIDTDLANFRSYETAIKSVIDNDTEMKFNPAERFTRTTLKTLFPNLSTKEVKKIVNLKEQNFKMQLSITKMNSAVMDKLLKYYKTNKTVLVTNCRKDRAVQTLDFHNLKDKFDELYFKQYSEKNSYINKYQSVLSKLNIPVHNIIVFENEQKEIDDAINSGIPIKNIISL